MITDKKELFNEEYCEIYFEASKNIITAKWKGFLKLDQVQHGCEIITEFVRKHEGVNHLSDHRELKILTSEIQNYLGGIWFPEVASVGLEKIAVLVAKDLFASLTVDKVNETNHVGSLQIKTFETITQCESFLTE